MVTLMSACLMIYCNVLGFIPDFTILEQKKFSPHLLPQPAWDKMADGREPEQAIKSSKSFSDILLHVQLTGEEYSAFVNITALIN